jgi:hypothetical protein
MMKSFRALSAALAILYAVAFLGAALHTHAKGAEDQQCNLCQAAHAPSIQAPNWHGPVELRTIGFIESTKPVLLILSYEAPHSGRAPPTA